MIMMPLGELAGGVVGVVNEGRSARLQLLENLRDVGVEDVDFGMNQGIERENEVIGAVFRRSQCHAVVAFEARMRRLLEPGSAGVDAGLVQIDAEIVLTLRKQEARPATMAGGDFQNVRSRQQSVQSGIEAPEPLRLAAAPRSAPFIPGARPIIVGAPQCSVPVQVGHQSLRVEKSRECKLLEVSADEAVAPAAPV